MSSSTPSFTVVVCRGCCCGSPVKHPTTDHDGHLAALADAARKGGARVRTSSCLGVCSFSNVVVVRPHGPDAAREARWFGRLHDDRLVEQLADWIRSGGPEGSALPDELWELEIPTLADH